MKEKIKVSPNSIYNDMLEIGHKHGIKILALIATSLVVKFSWWNWPGLKNELTNELREANMHELIAEAKNLFPDSSSDLEAVDEYKSQTFDKIMKLKDKEGTMFGVLETKYKKLSELYDILYRNNFAEAAGIEQ